MENWHGHRYGNLVANNSKTLEDVDDVGEQHLETEANKDISEDCYGRAEGDIFVQTSVGSRRWRRSIHLSSSNLGDLGLKISLTLLV